MILCLHVYVCVYIVESEGATRVLEESPTREARSQSAGAYGRADGVGGRPRHDEPHVLWRTAGAERISKKFNQGGLSWLSCCMHDGRKDVNNCVVVE